LREGTRRTIGTKELEEWMRKQNTEYRRKKRRRAFPSVILRLDRGMTSVVWEGMMRRWVTNDH